MNGLKKYISRGLLKKVSANFEQIQNQMLRAHRDIQTAQKIQKEDPLWAVTIIYQALLRAGRALLFSFGYLPIDGAQHKTTVECTGIILGKKFEGTILQFNKMRKERNTFFYDSEGFDNEEDVKLALEVSNKLLVEFQRLIDKNNPQKKLV